MRGCLIDDGAASHARHTGRLSFATGPPSEAKAIIWNLGTWWLGLPASSSHTLIGSIIGVGVANALMRGRDGTSGVDWNKAVEIGYALLLSPVVGFFCAAGLLLIMKFLIRKPGR